MDLSKKINGSLLRDAKKKFSYLECEELLELLNEKLKQRNIQGTLSVGGGFVMAMIYDRPTTVDIDGVYSPKSVIDGIIEEIAKEKCIPKNWLNDAIGGYESKTPEYEIHRKLSHLIVNKASLEYMLAMKCRGARLKSDIPDISVLIKKQGIKSAEEVWSIFQKFSFIS